MNQVRKVLPLHDADILHAGNRIVSQLESPPLNSGKPTFKTRKVQRNLLPRIDYENRTWCLQLCSSAFRNDRNHWWRHRVSGHLPGQGRGDECTSFRHFRPPSPTDIHDASRSRPTLLQHANPGEADDGWSWAGPQALVLEPAAPVRGCDVDGRDCNVQPI